MRLAWFDADKRRGLLLFLLSLAIVLAIAFAQRWGWLTPFNRDLMTAVGAQRAAPLGPAITRVMIAASVVGDTGGRIVLVLVSCAMLAWRRRGRQIGWLLVVTLGGMLLNLGLKQIFAAPRPDLLPHLDIVHTYSFPSGHAAGNLIFFGALAMIVARRAAWIAAAGVIILIGSSRVWLGVHWPSDVLAGWVEGIGWLVLCGAWLRR
ncbi:hypothetical protein BH10PSE12_BH10PSE12_21990 [soil metagenome]